MTMWRKALWLGLGQLQIHRSVFLPCEHQRVRHEGDKLCDTVNEIELLEFRECRKSMKHIVQESARDGIFHDAIVHVEKRSSKTIDLAVVGGPVFARGLQMAIAGFTEVL